MAFEFAPGMRVKVLLQNRRGIVTSVYQSMGREVVNYQEENGTFWNAWATELIRIHGKEDKMEDNNPGDAQPTEEKVAEAASQTADAVESAAQDAVDQVEEQAAEQVEEDKQEAEDNEE